MVSQDTPTKDDRIRFYLMLGVSLVCLSLVVQMLFILQLFGMSFLPAVVAVAAVIGWLVVIWLFKKPHM